MHENSNSRPGAFAALMRQRCPQCRRGIVFSNSMRMNRRCPYCGFGFEREPGFYSGAIYIGILMATPIVLGILCVLLLLFPELPPQVPAALAVFFFLPLMPLTIRLARVLWMGVGSPFSPRDGGGDPPPPPRPRRPNSPAGPSLDTCSDAGGASPQTVVRPERLLPVHVAEPVGSDD